MILLFLFLFHFSFLTADSPFEITSDLPATYQGRIHPLGVVAKLWVYDQQLQGAAFNLKEASPITLLWQAHFAEQPLSSEASNIPLIDRLRNGGNTLKMLPTRQLNGEWVSLHALKLRVMNQQQQLIPIGNFTAFSNAEFSNIRHAYFTAEKSLQDQNLEELSQALTIFTEEMNAAYTHLIQDPHVITAEKRLYYPSWMQLKVENWYYSFPLIPLTIVMYSIALLLAIFKKTRRQAVGWVFVAFTLHTLILALRCYILQRPPVSNMFETVLYVPWIAVVLGIGFYIKFRTSIVLFTGAFCSLVLLILLKLTLTDVRFENVQAVLDSQYWLTVHVLMVVGSYGAFALSGILGHYYLMQSGWWKREEKELTSLSEAVLYTMYVGVALLIPGTILGGVWAAESWGRFWDWDPKESWAFISACIYLLIIHAYRYHRISYKGLAIGSIMGLLAISFTWYGVNYILGTGLHSYGFGNGGEVYYYLYILGELTFLSSIWLGKD